MRNHAILRLLS